ncbi:MAG: 50S ribosomal protein L9 [bacterium]
MKRFISLIVAIFVLVLTVYIGIVQDVFNFDFSNAVNVIVVYLTIGLIFITGTLSILFYYRKKDEKIKWLSNRLEQWSNLTVHVNKAGDEVFSELPIGIIIYDEQEEIKWVNKFARMIFPGDLLSKSLSDVSEELQVLINKSDDSFTFEFGENSYDVIHKKDNRLLYLFDVSKREQVTKLYEKRIPALGIVNLDNLDNETKSFDMQEKINLRGQYLGEISDWAAKHNGYIKSYDDGSLIIVCDYSSVQKMVEEKFDVLNKIRDISQANGIRVSGSIGIACHDTNYEELGTLAQSAFDLAEKRGGDQAVVNIQHKKVQYFGASLNAVEKNTFLHARSKTLELKAIIDDSRNVYIMGHVMADADAFGACLGMLKMVLSSTKKVNIVLDPTKIDTTVTKIYNELMNSNEPCKNNIISFDQADIDEKSLLIVLDTQATSIVMDQQFLSRFKKVAVIDHHRTGEDVFENPLFTYVEPYASSTVELVSEMLMFFNPKSSITLSEFEATVMLTGLVVDTNNFTFRCGTRAFEAASRLRDQGANMITVRKYLRNEFSVQMLVNKYISNAKVLLNQFAVVDIEDTIEDRTLLAKISEALLNIESVDASFTLAAMTLPTGPAVSISARSYENINVQLIMEELGGGGHLNSAATLIKNCTIPEAKKMLAVILKRDYEIGDQKMKIILLEDVKGRGVKNDVIDVATGYGNYLLTNKKGIVATDESLAALQAALDLEKNRLEDEKKMMEKIKTEIESKVVNIHIKFGADGKAFGSVTTKQVSEELEAQHGIQVDKRKVTLPQELNSVGAYSATISLHKEVTAQLEINVLEK